LVSIFSYLAAVERKEFLTVALRMLHGLVMYAVVAVPVPEQTPKEVIRRLPPIIRRDRGRPQFDYSQFARISREIVLAITMSL
jgi:hypothetical protein